MLVYMHMHCNILKRYDYAVQHIHYTPYILAFRFLFIFFFFCSILAMFPLVTWTEQKFSLNREKKDGENKKELEETYTYKVWELIFRLGPFLFSLPK